MKLHSTVSTLLALHGFILLCTVNAEPKVSARDTDLGPSDYKCPDGVNVAPHEEYCHLYYICGTDKETHLYSCDGNMLFDLAYNGCNYPELVNCGSRLPPFTCPEIDGDYALSPYACDARYYTCVAGEATLNTCPNEGIFSQEEGCTAPGAISCPTPTTARTPTSAGPFECPEPNGNFPSPHTCTQYYVCIEGSPFLFECADGLYYNPALNICDWPANVPQCDH